MNCMEKHLLHDCNDHNMEDGIINGIDNEWTTTWKIAQYDLIQNVILQESTSDMIS
jgi:hypothetical protein